MKNVRKAVRKVNWNTVSKVAGGVVAFVGFFIMLGGIGSADVNLVPLKESVLVTLLGLSMFVGGAVTAQVFDFQQSVDNENLPNTVEGLLGAVAYNPSYKSLMMVVNYHDDYDWEFVLCSKSGRPSSTPITSNHCILDYRWSI